MTSDREIKSGVTSATGTGINKLFTELPTFCLLVDILGFRKMMLVGSAKGIAYDSAYYFNDCLSSFSPNGFTAKEIEYYKKKIMRLSDTIAMWFYTCESKLKTESTKEGEEKALLWIIKVAQHLLQGAFQQNRWALRGAIAFGEGIQDIDGRSIIGRSWAFASELEKSQEWAGITLHPTAAAKLTDEMKNSKLITRWPVPCKGNTAFDGWVVDWRKESITAANVTTAFDRIGEPKDSKAILKLKNTLHFLNQ